MFDYLAAPRNPLTQASRNACIVGVNSPYQIRKVIKRSLLIQYRWKQNCNFCKAYNERHGLVLLLSSSFHQISFLHFKMHTLSKLAVLLSAAVSFRSTTAGPIPVEDTSSLLEPRWGSCVKPSGRLFNIDGKTQYFSGKAIAT